uniref:Dynein assembly factor 3, axonemal n=1 Tax=Echinococcus canadensis TaxID=519352 RepID=A0A915EXS8_9CEST
MFNNESEALGYIAWWGLSPAINLLNNDFCKDSTINIYCFGMGDTRHIIKTISQSMDCKQRYKFNMFERSIELVARQILQLYIVGIPNGKMGLQEKTERFLELYGNTLIRETTETWLDDIATYFINIVTDTGIFDQFPPYISVNKLKSKDRDHLECVLKSWRRKNLPKFDISTYWNSRVRQHLGVRYDAIPNVFDWDCSIVLRDRGIKTIDSREYSRWRSTGVAFTPRQASYLSPNRSLASPRYFSHSQCTGDLGGSTLIGYWGDIVCSPFLAFGTFTDRSPELARTLPGGRIIYGASVLSELNLRCFLWEIAHGRKAPPTIASTEFGLEEKDEKIDGSNDGGSSSGKVADKEVGEESEPEKNNENPSAERPERKMENVPGSGDTSDEKSYKTVDSKRECTPDISGEALDSKEKNKDALAKTDVNLCERFEVDFYPPGTTFVDLSTRLRSQFVEEQDKASIIYVGCSSLSLLDKASKYLLDVCTDDCRLIIESILYIIGMKEGDIRGYVKRAEETANSLGFKLEIPVDPMRDHHLYFVRGSGKICE